MHTIHRYDTTRTWHLVPGTAYTTSSMNAIYISAQSGTTYLVHQRYHIVSYIYKALRYAGGIRSNNSVKRTKRMSMLDCKCKLAT